jgi:hypothetical protein
MRIGTKLAMIWHHTGFSNYMTQVAVHMLNGFVLPEDVERFIADPWIREAFFHAYRGGEDPVVAYNFIADMVDAQERLATTGIRS